MNEKSPAYFSVFQLLNQSQPNLFYLIRIFREKSILSGLNGAEIFSHPRMILKVRSLRDVYECAILQNQFKNISFETFKHMVPYYTEEAEHKWARDCFCIACGNSIAAVRKDSKEIYFSS